MPTPIDRHRLQELLEARAQLIEVLPVDEYDEEHLLGARSLALRQLSAATTADVDRSRPVVVYCWDGL